MEGYINKDTVIRAIEDHLCNLMDHHKYKVEITEFNVDIQNIIKALPVACGIEWIDAEWELPTESDEYLVIIAYADKPTTLYYDAEEQVFEGDTVFYKVTHWAKMPESAAK